MGDVYDKGFESIKTKPFDPMTMIFDEWFYGDFHHLVGAKNPKIYYLPRSGAGLLENSPMVASSSNASRRLAIERRIISWHEFAS